MNAIPGLDTSMDVSDDEGVSFSNMVVDADDDEANLEKLWAREQYEMLQQDREAAIDEIHGVKSRYDPNAFENHPQIVYQALIRFDNELNNANSSIPSELKKNYIRALRMNSSYVSSSDFRLRFLRTEFFDIRRAIERFCKCLNMLVEYFGDVGLLRQLFLSDLSKAERRLLKEGTMQLSASRDPLGRRILFFIGNVGENYSPRERNRVGMYLIFQVLAEDVTTQRNGFVTISFMTEGVRQALLKERNYMSNFFKDFFQSCPIRISAIHMCFPEELLYRLLMPLMLFIIGKLGRKNLKLHSGTAIECNYSLNSFGIRIDDIPVTYSGTTKTRQHTRWLKVRMAMDDYIEKQCINNVDGDYHHFYNSDQNIIKPFPHIQCPDINCVLFHKNGVAWDFPGNVKFRAFLNEQLTSIGYNKSSSSTNSGSARNVDIIVSPTEKERLFDRIIRLSLAQNFQFLLHDETKHWYMELNDTQVLRRYIGFAIRGHHRRASAKKCRQGEGNNTSDKQRTQPAVFTNMSENNYSCGPDGCFHSMR